MIIKEEKIDSILERLESDEDYKKEITDQFEQLYTEYFTYINQEILKMLNEQEGDLLMFIHTVLTEAFLSNDQELKFFELTSFFDIEEMMWTTYEENIKAPFRERITPVFEDCAEEDALAFVEDLLIEPEEEEEEIISTAGRDIIWNVSAAFIKVIS